MHKGTIIADLIAAVERAEQHAREAEQDNELERWYAAHHQQSMQYNRELIGVA
jgi:hypothetical protein